MYIENRYLKRLRQMGVI